MRSLDLWSIHDFQIQLGFKEQANSPPFYFELYSWFKEVPDGAILKLPAIDEKFSGLSAPSVRSHPRAIKQLIGDLINLMLPTDPLPPQTSPLLNFTFDFGPDSHPAFPSSDLINDISLCNTTRICQGRKSDAMVDLNVCRVDFRKYCKNYPAVQSFGRSLLKQIFRTCHVGGVQIYFQNLKKIRKTNARAHMIRFTWICFALGEPLKTFKVGILSQLGRPPLPKS